HPRGSGLSEAAELSMLSPQRAHAPRDPRQALAPSRSVRPVTVRADAPTMHAGRSLYSVDPTRRVRDCGGTESDPFRRTVSMALRLTIAGTHGPKLGTLAVKEFGPNGGTIGRSLECDWALPDSKRYLSSRHASIDFRSGSYYVIDTSMNGVFVNDADQPVGRGKPQRLFDGDRLRIGEYEITVEIDEDPISPLIEENHIDPVDLAQRVEAPEPTGNDMVDAYEITGVGIEMMLTDDELETLSPPPKSKGAYFEIVADAPARESKPRPAAASASSAKTGARADGLELADATQPALVAPKRPAARPAAATQTSSPKPAAASSAGTKAPAAAQRSSAPRSPAAPQPSATAQKPSTAAQ